MKYSEKLAARIASEGVIEVAKSMGITPLALAVICRENNIPWPGLSGKLLTASKSRAVKPTTEPLQIPMPTEADLKNGYLGLTRQTLYDLVWSHPGTKLAAAWGLSDVGLSKVCKKHNIPRPGLGYWARIQNGYKEKKRHLPNQTEADKEVWITVGRKGNIAVSGSDSTRFEFYKRRYEDLDENQAAQADELYTLESTYPAILVEDEVPEYHKLVDKTRRSLLKAKVDERKLVRPAAKGTLLCYIAPESIDRACRVLNTLIHALEARGWKPRINVTEKVIREREYWGGRYHDPVIQTDNRTVVEILGETVEFELSEKSAQKVHTITEAEAKKQNKSYWGYDRKEYSYHPTGNLTLKIKSSGRGLARCSWSDGKTQRLEEILGSFIRGIIDAAVDLRSGKLFEEACERRWAEERRKQEEHDRLIRNENARLEQLSKDLKSWEWACRVRAFVEAVRAEAVARGETTERGAGVGDWLYWTTKVAEREDPLWDEKLPEYLTYGQRNNY